MPISKELIEASKLPWFPILMKELGYEPVRHGHWIDAYPKIEPNPMFQYGICSVCGYEQSVSKYLKFCPNCGAKMDEVIDE